MALLTWTLFGLLVGSLARFVLGETLRGRCGLTLALAVAGAIAGGSLSRLAGRMESPTLGWSRTLAIAGAITFLGAYQRLRLWRFIRHTVFQKWLGRR